MKYKKFILLLACIVFLIVTLTACSLFEEDDRNKQENEAESEVSTEIFSSELGSEIGDIIDSTEIQVNSTEVSKSENMEQEIISTEKNETSSEKESSDIKEPTPSKPKDEFIEEICVLYSLEPVILYDAPSLEANIIMEWESYTSIALDAYNEKTGWYRTSMGYDEPMYCRMDNGLTLNEFRAILNEGVEEKYYCLGCVLEPERYAKTPYASYISRSENLACIHIKGEHNFVPVEVAEKSNQASYNAMVEWHEMVHAVNNQDGTVHIWTKEHSLPLEITLEEYYEKYESEGVVLYEDSDAYFTAKEEYHINAAREVINSH